MPWMLSLMKTPLHEGVLLIDASNAFNSLNRQATLMNVQKLCPVFAAALVNTYRLEPSLFIDGEIILSREGTTRGDPLAMAMYAIGILPLILHVQHIADQIWYADDSSAGGTIISLKKWWDELQKLGSSYGYVINPPPSPFLWSRSIAERKQNPSLKIQESRLPLLEVSTWVRPLVIAHSRKSSYERKFASGCWSYRAACRHCSLSTSGCLLCIDF